jgi:hypothetical protein
MEYRASERGVSSSNDLSFRAEKGKAGMCCILAQPLDDVLRLKLGVELFDVGCQNTDLHHSSIIEAIIAVLVENPALRIGPDLLGTDCSVLS